MGMRLVWHNTTFAMPAISVKLTVLDTNCSIINSRILRVEESFLLKDICCMVTFDDERCLMSVLTASDIGTRYGVNAR